jgi:hypothetical protein
LPLIPGTRLGPDDVITLIGEGDMCQGRSLSSVAARCRELYYIGPDGEMMAAPIAATGTPLEPGVPVALFPTRIVGGGVDDGQRRQYDVTRDGRFAINTVLDAAAPITLLRHWNPDVK